MLAPGRLTSVEPGEQLIELCALRTQSYLIRLQVSSGVSLTNFGHYPVDGARTSEDIT